jgi:hypothetical protein
LISFWRTAATGSRGRAAAAGQADGTGRHVLVLREEPVGPRQAAAGPHGVHDVGEGLLCELESEVEPRLLGHDGGSPRQRQLALVRRARGGAHPAEVVPPRGARPPGHGAAPHHPPGRREPHGDVPAVVRRRQHEAPCVVRRRRLAELQAREAEPSRVSERAAANTSCYQFRTYVPVG